jgi:hypothetical protein
MDRMMIEAVHDRGFHEALVLTKALARAAGYWDLSNRQLGDMIGLSEATISRLRNGSYVLDQGSKPWQLSVLFLRAYRGLDAYMGGHTGNEKRWLAASNSTLGGVPLELMRNVEGLAHVVQYVDYMRGQ